MNIDRSKRLRPRVVSAIGFSLASLLFGCEPQPSGDGSKGSPKVDTVNDQHLDAQALRSIPRGYHKRVCSDAAPGFARCHAQVRTDSGGTVQPLAGPSGLNPADLQSAYAVPSAGTSLTVAIVDAFDDPNAEADLAVYRAQFGLPPCTTANGCFKKVNQNGAASPLPSADSGWGLEISLDLQMVSAVCPTCKILLVEARNSSLTNLGTAVNTAASLGASAISNSYGGAESAGVNSFDTLYFNHPGVLVTASSGDNGYGVIYPASGAHVLGVGGTSLVRSSSSRGWAEAAWSGAGSGCSAWVAKPSFQTDTGCSKRTVADVSAVADPNTGASVYDTYGYSGWIVVGGTSAASPIVAATFAAAGMANVPNSYPYSNVNAFNDVTTGSNGTCGTPYLCNGQTGYDGPTGIGTPKGTAIAGGCGSGAPPPLATVTATDGTYSAKVQVTWAAWCATSYQVFRNTTNSTTGATQLGTPSASPYDDTSASPGLTYYYFVKACNSSGCSGFSPSDSGYRANATYDATLLAPTCSTPSSFCDSGDLVVGRATLGPEPNAPNTIANSPCSDGTAGTFHSDESLDRLQITSVDGTNLAPGKSVRIDATVWAYSIGTAADPDYLDLYLTTDAAAAAPVWTLLTPTSLVSSTTGAVVLSQTITLPATGGTQWAIRGNFRYNDSTHSTCSSGNYDDRDDLVFTVVSPPPSPPTGVSASDGTYTEKVQVSWTGSGATSYQVYRNTSNSPSGATQIGTPAASTYDDTGAIPGAIYYYFVKACNGAACSDFSLSDSGYRAISAPTGVSATDGTFADKVEVSWTASGGATSYQVYSNTTNSSTGATQVGTPTGSPFDDTTATSGTTYYYFVKACNGAVCSDFSASDSGYLVSYSLSGVTPNPATQGAQVAVTWSAPAGHSTIDWVAVAVAGAPDTQYLTYQWVPQGTTGSLTFLASRSWAAGSYEFRYFLNNTFQKVATVGFTINADLSSYSLTNVTPNPAIQGAQAAVTWNAPADHTTSDWVAVAVAGAPDTQYLTYQWVPSGTTGSLTFAISSGWAAGAYEFRYFLNNTFQKVATVGFTIVADLSSYSLTNVTPDPATQGAQAAVTWTAPADHSTIDWVAIAVAGAPDTQYLTYQWVPTGTTGSLTFTISRGWAAGAYEFRYFINNTFQKAATVGFTVAADFSSYSLTNVTPDPATQGAQAAVTWSAAADHSTIDWVAVAVAGAPDTQYLTYQWVPTGTTGSLTFAISRSWAAGSYEFRYFINNTFQKAATVGFTVAADLSSYSLANVTPNPATQGAQAAVTWSAPADHSTIDWVAVAVAGAPDTQYLTYQWVPTGTTGSLTFAISRSWAAGSYEFRYFINNTFQKAATVGFTVAADLSSYGLTNVTPNPATQGGQTAVTWSAPADHSTIDWVAVAVAGAPDTQYLTYQWVPTGTTGSLTFVVNGNWAAGSYELRYFINNTFQRAATVGFTVNATGP